MEDVDRLLEPNRIYGSIGVAVMRLYDLQNARTETLPRLRGRRCAAELCDAEGVAHVLLDRRRKAQEIALGRPDPMQRLLVGSQDTSHLYDYPSSGICRQALSRDRASKSPFRICDRRHLGRPRSAAIILGLVDCATRTTDIC